MTRFPAPMCDCGHCSKQHAPSAIVRATPRPCLVKDCECPHFKNVALATKIGKPETGDGQ